MTAGTANVDLRPASIEDADLLLAWRNESSARAASRSRQTVSETEHATWLTELFEDPHRHLWVAELAGDPVGQVRFDRVVDRTYEISVSVAANHRGKGLGARVIIAGCQEMWRSSRASEVIAWVRSGNRASMKAFSGAGFDPSGESVDGFERFCLARPAE